MCRLCFLQHVEVPVPAPKKDEVLLKLEATSINPVDWKIQKGMIRPLLPPKFPFIPSKFNHQLHLDILLEFPCTLFLEFFGFGCNRLVFRVLKWFRFSLSMRVSF